MGKVELIEEINKQKKEVFWRKVGNVGWILIGLGTLIFIIGIIPLIWGSVAFARNTKHGKDLDLRLAELK